MDQELIHTKPATIADSPLQVRRIQDAQGKSLLEKRVSRSAPLWAIMCLDRDFLISKRLKLDTVISPQSQELEEDDFFSLWELPGGSFFAELPMPLPYNTASLIPVIDRMIQMTRALGTLHGAGLVHGGIYPGAWFYAGMQKQWKLMHLGFSFYPGRENNAPINFLFSEELIPYLSPEQTGRTGRSVDPRSDLYSLGILFYELLCGQKPFLAEDKMELIHSHIAINAPLIQTTNLSLPLALSKVVAKTLAKDPNDRYRSTLGLCFDLELIQQGLEAGKNLDDFRPGTKDISDRLLVSNKIFGREKEIDTILQQISAQNHARVSFIQISGKTGTGKSAFLKELRRELELQKYLVAGAGFSLQDRPVPLTGMLEVFKDLIRRVLSENDIDLNQWKNQLREILGGQVAYLAEVLPGIEKLMGSQPLPTEALPKESEDRLTKALSDFLSVFTLRDKPLVILLDDFHEADPGELRLLESICLDGRINNLILIATSNSSKEASVDSFFAALENANTAHLHNSLQALTIDDISLFLSEVFGERITSDAELTNVFFQKTNGIPLLLKEFLQSCYQAGYFSFSREQLSWVWDLESMRAYPLPETVANMLLLKLNSVSEACMHLLELASIVGSTFGFDDLNHLLQKSEIEAANLLNELVFMGLITPVQTDTSKEGKFNYAFAHPRIQQAVWERISENRKSLLHFEYSKSVLVSSTENLSREQLLQLAGQLHAALSHWKIAGDEDDKVKQILLDAAQKCRNVFSYALAENYISDALLLMDDTAWERNHQQCFAIHIEGIKSLFLNGKQSEALDLFEKGAIHAKTVLDQARRYLCMVWLFTNDSQTENALHMAMQGLAAFGIKVPRNPNQGHMLWEIIRTRISMGINPIKTLSSLKVNSDSEALLLSELIYRSLSPASALNVNLLALLSLKQLQMFARFGLNPYAVSGITMYGFILSGGFGNFKKGYEFIKLGCDIADQLNDPFAIGTSRFAVGLQGSVFLPLADLEKPMEEAFLNFDISGDSYLASTGISTFIGNHFQMGTPLPVMEEKMYKLIEYAEKVKNNNTIILNQNFLAQIKLLQQAEPISDNAIKLACRNLDRTDHTHTFWSHCYQMLLCYLVKADDMGLQHAAQAKTVIAKPLFLMIDYVYFFYDSLLRCSRYKNGTQKEKKVAIKLIRKSYNILKARGKKAPLAYGNLLEGVKACEHILLQQYDEAYQALDRALLQLRPNEYHHHRAIFLNLQAEIKTLQGDSKQANLLLQDAYTAFKTWGAVAVCMRMEKDFPQHAFREIITENASVPYTSVHHQDGQLQEDPNIKIDLSSVLKASQAISTEIELPRLLKNLLDIIMQNAGATRGVLIMPLKGQLCVMAEGTTGMQDVKTLQKIAIQNPNAKLPQSLIQYAARTQEMVRLDDAAHSGQFGSDPYIAAGHMRSAMALPVMKQGKLMLIMYLENSLTAGVFSNERVSILEMLSGQIGVSIENATLFEHVSDINKAYERFVPYEFLEFLGKESITDVVLGDQVQREMTVLFADIRGFTALSERMTPEENFAFINRYLSVMEPVIRKHNGFIDKFIGDGIMALFPKNPSDAVQAALSMSEELDTYNTQLNIPIEIGIGINWGNLMLGTVGGSNRMDGTVISDTVNVAARVERLTKEYQTRLIITEAVYLGLSDADQKRFTQVGGVRVRGRSDEVPIYRVLPGLNQSAQ